MANIFVQIMGITFWRKTLGYNGVKAKALKIPIFKN